MEIPVTSRQELEQNGIPASVKERYLESGALIIKNGFDPYLDEIKTSIYQIIQSLLTGETPEKCEDTENFDQGIYELVKKDRKLAGQVYDIVRHIRPVRKYAGDDLLDSLLKNLMDSKLLYMNHNWMLAMKLPKERKNVFPWHQDLPYTYGSQNGVTLWTPFKNINGEKGGGIEVILGSHSKGLLPFREVGEHPFYIPEHTKYLDSLPKMRVKLDAGDIIVFHISLVHKSIPNSSDRCIWNLEVRYSDTFDKEVLSRGWYPLRPAKNDLNYLPDYYKKKVVGPSTLNKEFKAANT